MKKIQTILLALVFTLGTSVAAYAAKCTTTITKPDGTTIVSEIEGDTCTIDLDSGTCSCS